jgi:hypothetical protein
VLSLCFSLAAPGERVKVSRDFQTIIQTNNFLINNLSPQLLNWQRLSQRQEVTGTPLYKNPRMKILGK